MTRKDYFYGRSAFQNYLVEPAAAGIHDPQTPPSAVAWIVNAFSPFQTKMHKIIHAQPTGGQHSYYMEL